MWTRTGVTDVLGIDYPILQGPFGGGFSSVDLVAAVSGAGGLGGFGAVGLAPDEIRAIVRDIAARTDRPFAINLWVPLGESEQAPPAEAVARACARLRPYFDELGLPPPALPPGPGHPFAQQVEALLEARPPVWSFIMGVPDAAMLTEARRRGIRTIGTATSVEEAVALEVAGVDVVVASGSDAGGHRGAFLEPPLESLVGTFSLVPQVARAIQRPVIAAGGIADGGGIAAALALGAAGVQIGTAFLATPEAAAPPAYKQRLGQPGARATRLTRALSGRYARGLTNALMLALEEHPEDILPYPAQGALTLPLRRAAAAAGRADRLALWAGQAAALARPLPAAELLRTLVEETDRVLRHPRLRPRT
jgi:nitronate monooxygenase